MENNQAIEAQETSEAYFARLIRERDAQIEECKKRILQLEAEKACISANAEAHERLKWRHKKRGTEYVQAGMARLQTADAGALRDMEEMVIYRGGDGQLWVRAALEFHDGRFEQVAQ